MPAPLALRCAIGLCLCYACTWRVYVILQVTCREVCSACWTLKWPVCCFLCAYYRFQSQGGYAAL